MDGLVVRPFNDDDQREARSLVLAGLGDRFGFIDETLNPDLDDIGVSYADGLFLVAENEARIAGTGALLVQEPATATIHRMSTAREHRRRGIGLSILRDLVEHAQRRGCVRAELKTQAAWYDAVAFYHALGFRNGSPPGDADPRFVMELPSL